ncbi:MAG: hypothetical protein COB66_03990 [Coxiella sp. (in: Bacteria)]|nr:MAG: hypothetical protein COB66_03990 [Coxiella sp. (in: g-proteobacteria)]
MQLDLENLSGALFKNKYKTEGSNQPDYKGSFSDKNTKEKVLDIAAWETTSKDGATTYFSLKISEPFQPNQQSAPSHAKAQPQRETATYDDDIPF